MPDQRILRVRTNRLKGIRREFGSFEDKRNSHLFHLSTMESEFLEKVPH